MRYYQTTSVGNENDPGNLQIPHSLRGANPIKRQRHRDSNYLVREFSLNQLIANARKVGISLKGLDTWPCFKTIEEKPARANLSGLEVCKKSSTN